jgi:acetate kinase
MKILVLNAGSSSLKYSVFEGSELVLLANGLVEKIGDNGGKISFKYLRNDKMHTVELDLDIKDHKAALYSVVDLLKDQEHGVLADISEISTVGHRVVHGGEYYSQPAMVDENLKQRIKELIPLAPLHNPANLLGIEVSEEVFPQAKQIAVFDTAFHQSLPEYAYHYALPKSLYEEYGIRVYGMHGTSHQYVASQAANYLNVDGSQINLISIHLGNGCSMSAIKNGKCIDTSLGFSPLPGLVMGTRSGDIDPSIIFHLLRTGDYTAQQIETMLNKESGLKGLAGFTDLRDIHRERKKGDQDAQLALDIYCYRIKKYIGSYLAVLGNLDAIVMTAGVGENDSYVREHALSGLTHFGIEVDRVKNQSEHSGIQEIQSDDTRIKLLVIPTDEEKQIALSCLEVS